MDIVRDTGVWIDCWGEGAAIGEAVCEALMESTAIFASSGQ